MGIFSFFSKEKKETLDKGLSKTKENVFSKITRAIAGKSKVDDEVLDNLEEVLITSDVGVDTTLKIISRIEDRVARDKYVTTSELTAILREEIASLLTENHTEDLESFLFMFVNAFASTSSSLVSNLIGAGKPEQVMGLCGRMIRICYYFVLPLGILIALFPELVLRIYTDNTDLIAGSVSSLWVMLSSYLIAVPAFIFFFSVSGTGNTQTALLIDMVSIFVYVFYALWVGIRIHADVAVCWTTEHVYDLMILSAFFYLWKGNWQNKKL